MLLRSISHAKIQWVHRVQNKAQWRQYADKRSRMSARNRGIVNEFYLFHGSPNFTDICQSEEGFDMRLANSGLWGKANYFSETAKYSDTYAFKDGATSCHVLIIALVLTGISYASASYNSLVAPPNMAATGNGVNQKYDSVTGMTGQTKVYMTYSNDLAYPAYLICYKPSMGTTSGGHAYSMYENPLLPLCGVPESEVSIPVGNFNTGAIVQPIANPLGATAMNQPPPANNYTLAGVPHKMYNFPTAGQHISRTDFSHPGRRAHTSTSDKEPLLSQPVRKRSCCHRTGFRAFMCIFFCLCVCLVAVIVYLVLKICSSLEII